MFVNDKHLNIVVFVMYKIESPKLTLCACTNVICDSIFGGGTRGVAHNIPTNQNPSIALIFVHSSLGIQLPKEKPAGGGWGILNKRQMEGRGAGAR